MGATSGGRGARGVAPARRRGRGPALFALGLAAVGLAPIPTQAIPECAVGIRVLLAESVPDVRVALGGDARRFVHTSTGVRSQGRALGRRWQSTRFGPWRVLDQHIPGRLEIRWSRRGLGVIAHIPLEAYVAGTLAGEVPASWPAEALRAQAVASRTYALHQRDAAPADQAWDVRADTSSQVYTGRVDPEPALGRAVSATRCEILGHEGTPILAAFHSASGGRTASAAEVWGEDLGYLRSRPVEGEDDSPDTYWRHELSRTTLSRRLEAAGHRLGAIHRVVVEARSASGRVARVRLEGSRSRITISGRALRSALGERSLRSTLFELRELEGSIAFVGSGNGHGVGMSQWGARAMAAAGHDYRRILQDFYPGTQLIRLRGARGAGPAVAAPPPMGSRTGPSRRLRPTRGRDERREERREEREESKVAIREGTSQ